ncbi:MAG: type II CAAX endopeptidase family protein [Limnochordia bacterium]
MWPKNASNLQLTVFISATLLISIGAAVLAGTNPKLIGVASIGYVVPAVVAITLNILHHKGVSNVYQPVFYGTTRRSLLFAVAYPAVFVALVAVIAVASGKAVINSGNLPAFTELAAVFVIIFLWMVLAFGEEYGWRGFLLPALAARFGRLRATIVVGLVWALYHLPADYLVNKGSADVWLTCLIHSALVFVTSFPISYCYFQTKGSITGVLLFRAVWDVAHIVVLGAPDSKAHTVLVGSYTIFGSVPLTLIVGTAAAIVFGWMLSKNGVRVKEKA